MSRTLLLEAGAISEFEVRATRLEPKTTYFVKKHSSIKANYPSH